MSEIEEAVKSAVKVNKKGIQLSWWLLLVAVIAFGGVFFLVNANKTASKKPPVKVDTKEEINIKQTLSSQRGDIVRYFETNKTYVGWTVPAAVATKVKAAGSEVKSNLTATSYVIYAKMPNSKLTFCMDSKGFTSEVSKVASKTSCN